MGIKGILTLIAIGGIAAGGYYFKDGIKDAFASGKDKITSVKDKLQDGYQGGNGNNSNSIPNGSDNYNSSGKSEGGKDNNSKEDNTQFVYIPIYQNDGVQSAPNQNDAPRNNNKQNPEITQYIKNDRKKTSDTVSKYTAQADRNNQDAYSKRKYGIDYDALTKAASKQESKRTTDEKKQLEAAKAREIFDSRSINNW